MGRHPAVYLMGRGAIPSRLGFARGAMRPCGVIRYYPRFPEAIPEEGAGSPRVTQPFATRFRPRAGAVRLACVRRAASVHPEPGSNSPSNSIQAPAGGLDSNLGGACRPEPANEVAESDPFRSVKFLVLRKLETGPGPHRGQALHNLI